MLSKVYLLFLGLIVHLIAAQGTTGVRLDASLLTGPQGQPIGQDEVQQGILKNVDQDHSFFGWTSILRYGGTRLTDGELVALASQAWTDMANNANRLGLGRKIPGVLTALRVDDTNTVYLGSSTKGRWLNGEQMSSWVYAVKEGQGLFNGQLTPSGLQTALQACLEAEGGQHRTDASCGEISAIYQWFLDVEGANLQNLQGTVVAWSQKWKQQGAIANPCTGRDDEWGCRSVVAQFPRLTALYKSATQSANFPEPPAPDYRTLWQRVQAPQIEQ